jgi:putative transposase
MIEAVAGSVGARPVRKWQRRSKAAWQALIARQAISGETIEAFCRAQGVSRSSFERGRGLLSPAATVQDVSLQSVAPHNDRPAVSERSAEHCFIDAGEIGLGGNGVKPLEIRLELGGGIVLTIRRG